MQEGPKYGDMYYHGFRENPPNADLVFPQSRPGCNRMHPLEAGGGDAWYLQGKVRPRAKTKSST